MAHHDLIYHIVWRTKYSKKAIAEEHERELFAYIMGICREKNCRLLRINAMPDHIHLCINIHPTIAVSDLVRIVKQESSKWMRNRPQKFPLFEAWGNGYAAFTYSAKERANVIDYIMRQKEHHKHKTFREEYEEWLAEMGENPANDLFFKD